MQQPFHLSKLHIMQFIHGKKNGLWIFWTFSFCLMTQVSICLHVCHWTKTLVFLRFRLPVLLQQNLRCKVWDDTAKIRYIYMYVYIALFAVSEQCSQRDRLDFNINSLSQQCSFRNKINIELISSTSTTSIPHAYYKGHIRERLSAET